MPPAMLLQVPETGSKISAELVAPPPDTVPPATRTRPSCKVAEIWLLRGSVSPLAVPMNNPRSKRGNRPVGVEQFGARNRSASRVAACDQNAAILQQSGGGARTGGGHVSCRLPRAARNRQNETLECDERTKQECRQEHNFSESTHR